jgi:hypothetical protein
MFQDTEARYLFKILIIIKVHQLCVTKSFVFPSHIKKAKD